MIAMIAIALGLASFADQASTRRGDGQAMSRPALSRQAKVEARAKGGAIATPAEVAAEIARGLQALWDRDEELLSSDLFRTARRAFQRAAKAAEDMLGADGAVVEAQVDRFHDYLDEFLLALRQLGYPGDHYADKASREQKGAASRLSKDLEALARRANEVPALRRASTGELRQPTDEEIAWHVPRILSRLEVLVMHRGMGPLHAGAPEDSQPLRDSLKRVGESAGRLGRAEGDEVAAARKELAEQLQRSIDLTAKLVKLRPALVAESMGNRAKRITDELTALRALVHEPAAKPGRKRS